MHIKIFFFLTFKLANSPQVSPFPIQIQVAHYFARHIFVELFNIITVKGQPIIIKYTWICKNR